MFRDRTNLFLSYRRTVPRSNLADSENRFDSLVEQEEGLIGSRRGAGRYHDNNSSIELKPIIPSIFDISKELDENLINIKQEINELNSLYKKLIIVTKNEKKIVENKLDNLNYQILKNFERCYVLIKKFEYLGNNHEKLKLNYTENDLEIINNFKKNYATIIQDSSLRFRNLQNNYIKFLKDDEDEQDNLLNSYTNESQNLLIQEEESSEIENYSKHILQQQQQQHSNSQYLQSREKEISKIAMGILEISTIFKEMETLVVDQGSLLDRIDYNLQNTVQDLKSSDKELIKAKHYQKRTTKCKLIFLLSLIVFVLFILVLVKPHGSTKIVEKPSPSHKNSNNNANSNNNNEISSDNDHIRPEISRPENDKGSGNSYNEPDNLAEH